MRPFGRLSVLAFALVAALTASPLAARDLTTEERLADFDQLVGMVRSSYGMLEYKTGKLGIDLAKLTATYRAQVQAVTNDNAFYDLLSAFLSEFKDAHVGHFRPSNARATLGFSVNRIEEKAVIVGVNRKILPEEQFPFHEGDELVSIDGKPVARIIQEMVPMHASSTEESSLGLMTRALTSRAGWLGPVPTGVARLEIRPANSEEAQAISTPWIVRGKFLPGLNFHSENPDSLYPIRPGTTSPDLSRNPIAGAFDSQVIAPWMPADAQVIEAKYYGAALFNTEKGLMGYIRIPTFMVESDEEAVAEFRKLLKDMRFTKGLVLDLNDNPGGSLFYCYKLASMFANKPLELPMVSERASRTNLSSYEQWAELEPAAVTKQLYQLAAESMRKAMEGGKDMTEFMYSFGVSTQVPDAEVTYAAPVLMLINDQCYSCGDVFPALLKDNGRATLMGTTTAGAGGAVGSFGPLAYSGSSINLTLNLMRRVDGTFIENNGVAPDVTWQHTQQDVAGGYETYRRAYTAELLKLVP